MNGIGEERKAFRRRKIWDGTEKENLVIDSQKWRQQVILAGETASLWNWLICKEKLTAALFIWNVINNVRLGWKGILGADFEWLQITEQGTWALGSHLAFMSRRKSR